LKPRITRDGLEVVEYSAGQAGYTDVASYDAVRYAGSANEHKQQVMARAYWRLIGPLDGKRVLDVGCGTGRGLAEFGRRASFAAGTDASLEMLGAARKKLPLEREACVVQAIAQRLPFGDSQFDVITALNFLHLFSLDTQRTMVAEMKRVLKREGFLVLEFDNALNGIGVGLYKRWRGVEQGALPHEIRYVLGCGCRVARVYGAVLPIVWRWLHRAPSISFALEKVGFIPLLNRLGHRVYYKVMKQ
jgi:ubiquinone/menaquinone biosynthesis C-methylase UbiE